jgi:hypothetical protein
MQFSGLKMWVAAATLLAATVFTSGAQATLIVNGGFEANPLKNNQWTYLNSKDVLGWQGSNIEIWHHLNRVLAPEGNHHIELNADGKNSGQWSIFQTFATTKGQLYDFSFYYRARANTNEAFEFSIGNVEALVKQHSTSAWNKFSGSFVADSTSSTIRFTSLNTGTVGNFIDDVVVTQALTPLQAEVPAAPTLAVLGLGLLALLFSRRQIKG